MPRIQTVDLSTLARSLDLTPRRVQQLTTEGVLVRARDEEGKELRGRYELVRNNHAYIHYLQARLPIGESAGAADRAAMKAQREAYETEMALIKLNLLRGKVYPAAVVELAITTMVTACKQRLLAIPARVARLLIGCKTFKEAFDLIYHEIELALRELTGYDANYFRKSTEEHVASLGDEEQAKTGEAASDA